MDPLTPKQITCQQPKAAQTPSAPRGSVNPTEWQPADSDNFSHALLAWFGFPDDLGYKAGITLDGYRHE